MQELRLVSPQITPFDFGFGDEPANTGDIAGILCMVARGDLPVDIFWNLNSQPIVTNENGFTITRMNMKTSSLSIDSLDAIHRGTYSCIARNKAGFAEYHTELQVNGYYKVLPTISFINFFLIRISLNPSTSLNNNFVFQSSTANVTVRFW